MSRLSIIVLVAAATLVCGRSASAQYASPAGLQRTAAPHAARPVALALGVTADGSRLRGAAHGALIGTGVGVVVGIVVVAATPHSDHSEDAVGPIIGAFFGLLIGAAIGAAHPR